MLPPPLLPAHPSPRSLHASPARQSRQSLGASHAADDSAAALSADDSFSLDSSTLLDSPPLDGDAYTADEVAELHSLARALAEDANVPALRQLFLEHTEPLWPARADIIACVPESVHPASFVSELPMPGVSREEFTRDSGEAADPLQATAESDPQQTAATTEWYTARIHAIDAATGLLDYASSLCEFARSIRVPGLDSLASALADLDALVYTHGLDYLTLKQFAALSDFERLGLVLRATSPNSVVSDLRTKGSLFFQRATAGSAEQHEAGDPFALSSSTSPLLRRYMLSVAGERMDLVHAIIVASKPRAGSGEAVGTPTATPPLIPDHADLISLAIECCYAATDDADAPDADILRLLTAIFECLPQRSSADDARLVLLHRYVDEFDVHLTATEILSKYAQARPLSFFLSLPLPPEQGELARWGPYRVARDRAHETQQSWSLTHPRLRRQRSAPPTREQQCVQLLEAMARRVSKKTPAPADDEWQTLLSDLLELRLKVFPFVPARDVYVLFLRSALAKERWSLAKRILHSVTTPTGSAEPVLSRGDAERLVLDVARESVNSAPSANHFTLRQAEACLQLLPIAAPARNNVAQSQQRASSDDDAPFTASSANRLSTAALTSEWQHELNLLTGLQRLDKLGISDIVPLEIRLAKGQHAVTAKDRGGPAEQPSASSHLSILELLLRSHPLLYLQADQVMDIMRCLSGTDDAAAAVDCRLAFVEAAMRNEDSRTALQILLNLMEQQPPQAASHREKASQLCHELSQQLHFGAHSAPVDVSDTLVKPTLHLLAHSLWSCVSDEQLNAYLEEFKQISAKQPSTDKRASPNKTQRNQASDDDEKEEKSPDEDEEDQAQLSPDAVDDDSDDIRSDVERLIASSFQANNQADRQRPQTELLTLTYTQKQQQAEASSEYPFDTAAAAATLDALLLDLVAQSCGVDNSLALSYLLSLSDPLSARAVLDVRMSPEADRTAAPTLTQAERQETVELAMRFFSILALLHAPPDAVLRRIEKKLSATRATSTTPPTAASSPTQLTSWEFPSIAELQDCSLDTLQAYVELLSSAFDDECAAEKPASLLSALHYNSVRNESKKSEYILQHCPNLDSVKFTTDARYRVDSILQLARGNQAQDEVDEEAEGAAAPSHSARDDAGDNLSSAQMFDIALTLCKRYHLSSWEMYMARCEALFTRRISLASLRSHLAALHDHLQSNPVSTYAALVGAVWPSVRGDDLPRLELALDMMLACFATLLQSYQTATSSFTSPAKKKNVMRYEVNLARLQAHKELLEKIQSIALQSAPGAAAASRTPPRPVRAIGSSAASPSSASSSASASAPLDYKLLLASPATCVVELRKLLTEHNIFLVSRLTSKIQDLIAANSDDAQGQVLFPALNPKASLAAPGALSLTDVFPEVPSVAPSAAPVFSIDSSLIFMLFLSKSLRKHVDALVAIPAAVAKSAALPAPHSVAGWFAQFDRLLKRLSVAHYVRLIVDCVHEGSDAPTANFSVHPLKAELQARLEVSQCGLRVLEQLPAWSGAAAAAAAASTPPSTSRSVSVDFDSAAASLSPEMKASLYDQLVSVHTAAAILCGVFDLACINATPFWPQLVAARGDSAELHALLQRVVLNLTADSPLKAADVKRICDKIRVLKDSAEYRSADVLARVAAEEKRYSWSVFDLVRECVACELNPSRYVFERASLESVHSIADLASAVELCRLASACVPCSLPRLIASFSVSLKEEQNIELFQAMLQFVSNDSPAAISSVDHQAVANAVQQVRAQLQVLAAMDAMATAASRGVQALQPTLQEQLQGSAALRSSLRVHLHSELLLLRCLQCSAETLFSLSPATLASHLEAPQTCADALAGFLAQLSSDEAIVVELHRSAAATLAVLHASEVGASQKPISGDSAWFALISSVLSHRQWGLLSALYSQPLTAVPLTAQLSSEQQSTVYRRALEQCDDHALALQIGFRSSAASGLPKLAMQHLAALSSASPPLRLDDALLRTVLQAGFFLSSLEHPTLLRALSDALLHRYDSLSVEERRSEVSTGSLAHCLALLCQAGLHTQAMALFYRAQRTHELLLDAGEGRRLLKSFLQQAKAESQQQHSDAQDEAEAHRIEGELNAYREATAALVMIDFAR